MTPGVPSPQRGHFVAALLYVATACCCQAGIFSNTNQITINDSMNPPTKAGPYPSTINVSGFTNNLVVSKVTATFYGFTHGFPSDVTMLLVGPQGQNAVIMAETGGQDRLSVSNITFTLDDNAATNLPTDTMLTSGTFQPLNGYSVFGSAGLPFNVPPPAPPGNSNSPSALSTFKYTNPNGAWQLFVVDDVSGDSGFISGGWSLNITAGFPLNLAVTGPNVVLSWPTNAVGYQLQAAANPLDSNSWRYIITPPVIISNRYTVVNPMLYSYDYYRLVHH